MNNRATSGNSFSRIDRAHHSQALDDYVWFGEVTCRTTNVPPIPLDSSNYPIAIYLKDPKESDIKQFKKIWRASTSLLLQSKHIQCHDL